MLHKYRDEGAIRLDLCKQQVLKHVDLGVEQ